MRLRRPLFISTGISQFYRKSVRSIPVPTTHSRGTGSSRPGLTEAKEQVETRCHHVQPGQGRVRLERCNCWDSKGQDGAPDHAAHSGTSAVAFWVSTASSSSYLSLRAHVITRSVQMLLEEADEEEVENLPLPTWIPLAHDCPAIVLVKHRTSAATAILAGACLDKFGNALVSFLAFLTTTEAALDPEVVSQAEAPDT